MFVRRRGRGAVQSDPGFLSCGFKWCREPAGDVQRLKKCFRRPHSDRYSYTLKSVKTCSAQPIRADKMPPRCFYSDRVCIDLKRSQLTLMDNYTHVLLPDALRPQELKSVQTCGKTCIQSNTQALPRTQRWRVLCVP